MIEETALQTFLFAAVAVLVANVVVGVLRLSRGPVLRDRMAGLVLLSTTGTAVLIVLAEAMNEPSLRVVAVVLVALAVVVVIALVAYENGKTS